VLSRLGLTELARRRLEQATATEKRAGDKLFTTGQVLSRRAQSALRGGDVAQARLLTEELLRMARRSGARVYEASGLYDLGRVQREAGDLAGAQASLQQSLKISEDMGDGLRSALARIELARLALAGKRYGQAGELARAAAAWLAQRGFTGLDAEALALAAEASLRAGRLEEAEESLEKVRGVAASLQDRELGLRLAASLARSAAAAGDQEGAARALRVVISDAAAKGFVLVAGEARRSLAEMNAG
jgi:tetratricopeptide (TPR) repeat protein